MTVWQQRTSVLIAAREGTIPPQTLADIEVRFLAICWPGGTIILSMSSCRLMYTIVLSQLCQPPYRKLSLIETKC